VKLDKDIIRKISVPRAVETTFQLILKSPGISSQEAAEIRGYEVANTIKLQANKMNEYLLVYEDYYIRGFRTNSQGCPIRWFVVKRDENTPTKSTSEPESWIQDIEKFELYT
jgi:hypothetical protein